MRIRSVLWVTLLVSSAQATPRTPTHVACVGDSITEGAGASGPAKNYVEQLQLLLGSAVDIQNFGKSGATLLSQGFGDKPYNLEPEFTEATAFVDNAPPNAVVSVIINLGANDSKPFNWDQAGKPAQFKADYLALVDHFLGLKSKPAVYVAFPLATGNNPCCEIRGNIIRDEQLPLIRQVAMERGIPIIDLNTGTTNHPEYFGDGVHPNDTGYQVMAQLVKTGLEREPSVSVTAPAMGAMLNAGVVPITAAASGDTVEIRSVEFLDGATSLGRVTMPPWTLSWQATAGPHELSVRAVDATLAEKTSEPITVTVAEALGGGTGGMGGLANATGGTTTDGGATAATGGAPMGTSGSGAGGSGEGGFAPNPSLPTPEGSSSGCAIQAIQAPRRGHETLTWLAVGIMLLSRRTRSFPRARV